MRQIALIFFFVIASVTVTFSQTKEYREKFTQGNFLVLEQNYLLALDYYLEAYRIDSSNANINYKVGLCYLKTPTQKNLALPFLQKAIQNVTHNYDETDPTEKKAPESAYALIGEAYRLAYRFNESTVYFNTFKDLIGDNNRTITSDLSSQIDKNFTAIEFLKDTNVVVIHNLGDSINTTYQDYSPIISSDMSTLIFTSRRPGSTGGEKTTSDEYYDDIYYSAKGEDGRWSKAVSIGPPINTINS
ncbi:MAG TPA: hypothetical protein VFF27_16145, partial [Bacteroidia bacterium]|nr:hypothetical protein [Bacteroidia bacterium]